MAQSANEGIAYIEASIFISVESEVGDGVGSEEGKNAIDQSLHE